jgi:hypothetical protein
VLGVETENRIIGRQYGAAAVSENDVHALVGQHLDDDLGAGHGFTRQGVRNSGQFLRSWASHPWKFLSSAPALQ